MTWLDRNKNALLPTRGSISTDKPRQRLESILDAMGIAPTVRGVRIICCDVTPTGCWLMRANGAVEIRINADLAEEATDEELEALIAHEIFHHVGYQNARRLSTVFQALPCLVNVIFDIAINTLLGKRIGMRRGLTALFDRLIGHLIEGRTTLSAESAICMLSHPEPPLDRMPASFQAAWRQLWERPSVPSPETCFAVISELLIHELPSLDNHTENSVPNFLPAYHGSSPLNELLPGSSKSKQTQQYGNSVSHSYFDDRESTEALTNYVESRTGGTERSDDWIRVDRMTAPSRSQSRAVFQAELPSSCCQHVLNRVAGDLISGQKQTVRHLPYCIRPTTRAMVNWTLDIPKLHFANRNQRRFNALPLYIDVSRSMLKAMPTVQGLIQDLRHILPSRVFLFDTEVREQLAGEALSGLQFYGGGTDFDAFVSHALRRNYRDALVVTDGCGEFSDSSIKGIRSGRLKLRAMFVLRRRSRVIDEAAWFRTAEVDASEESDAPNSRAISMDDLLPKP